MVFGYFAATVIAVFNDETSKDSMGATADPEWLPLEQLVEARAVSAANPSAGWGLISDFRSSRAMSTLEVPQPPGIPRERTSRLRQLRRAVFRP